MSTELVLPPKEMTEYRSNIVTIQTAVRELVVENAEDVVAAENLLKMVHDGEKAITSRKEEITRPLMTALSSTRDMFKPLETGFAEAKRVLKDKILQYQVTADQKEEERKAKLAARVEKGTMTAETASTKMETVGTRANTRTVKKLVIVDETLIPRRFLVPDRSLITQHLLNAGEVPGVKLIEEKTIAVR